MFVATMFCCGQLVAQSSVGQGRQSRSQQGEQQGQSIETSQLKPLTLESTRSQKTIIRSGMVASKEYTDSMSVIENQFVVAALDTLSFEELDSLIVDDEQIRYLSVEPPMAQREAKAKADESLLVARSQAVRDAENEKVRSPYFSDSMSYRRVVGSSIFMPGFGQIYNNQAWKLPIVYGAIASSSALLAIENKRYRPIKSEYEEYTYTTTTRSDYLDELQADYIRSSRRRNTYIAMITASAIYSLGDAAVNYSTGDVSPIRKATTLSAICPGAGQAYNRSYWKLPFIVGGITSMVFVFDWNNRGYVRFSKAYEQVYAYEQNPDDFPDGPIDEFGGRYTSSYMKDLRDSYRRNRDLSIIIAVGLYVFQIIDANVDAHLKDFDMSQDLSFNVSPLLDYTYLPSSGSNSAIFGLNFGFTF